MALEWHQLDFINLRPCVSSCRLDSSRVEVFTIVVNISFIIVIIFMGMRI